MKNIFEYIKLMRVKHYIKNVLIFLPIIFSKNIFNLNILKNTIIGAVSFSLIASIVYIINDILDVEVDRRDEKKKFRPIASGKISKRNAIILAITLLVISIILNVYISVNIKAYIILYGYLFMNILYSVKLKHIPIVDIVVLAFGFILRVIYGSEIGEIEISNWLYLTILVFSFYMGLGKRRNEYKKVGDKGRNVLKYYNESFLNSNMYMFMALGIVFYSLWCIDINIEKNKLINNIWTVPLVMIICMRYNLNIEGESTGDPVDVLLNDKVLVTLTLAYAAMMLAILYM